MKKLSILCLAIVGVLFSANTAFALNSVRLDSASEGTFTDKVQLLGGGDLGGGILRVYMGDDASVSCSSGYQILSRNEAQFSTFSVDITNVPAGVQKYFKVGRHASLTGGLLNCSSAMRGYKGPPLPPTGTVASQGTLSNGIQITWNASATGGDGISYKVYRSPHNANNFWWIADVAGTTYTDTNNGLVPGTLYDYYVTSIKSLNESVGGGVVSGFVKAVVVPNNYTLTISNTGATGGVVTGNSINCGAICTASYVSGTSVTLTATAPSGGSFTWGGACAGSTGITCSVDMVNNRNVSVNFTGAPTTCTPNWNCTSWSPATCTTGTQTRTCSDSNSCGVSTGRPELSQTCTVPAAGDWFSLSNGGNITAMAGSSVSNTVTANATANRAKLIVVLFDRSQSANIGVDGLPSGVTFSTSPAISTGCSLPSKTSSCVTTFNFTIPASVSPGTYPITVKGGAATDPGVEEDHSTNFNLTIAGSLPPPPSSECDAVAGSSWFNPGGNPPEGNALAPLNVGSKSQTKKGCLAVGGTGTQKPVYPLDVTGNGLISGVLMIGNRLGIGLDTTPSVALDVNGSIKYTGSLVGPGSSDERLKKNIVPMSETLAKILQLKPVTFQWKDSTRPAGTKLGLIAQDVEKIFPEVVTTGSDGFKSVDYAALVGPVIKASQEQEAEIKALRAELELLKAAK